MGVRKSVERSSMRVTFDDPATRNALTLAVLDAIEGAFADAASDDDVRAVLLTHTGSTFCSGARLPSSGSEPSITVTRLVDILVAARASPKPVVARIDGGVRGGGLALCCACDFVVASTKATFAAPEVRLGLPPTVVLPLLAQRIGTRRALEVVLSGRVVSSEEASALGLVSTCTAPEALDAGTDALLTDLARGAPSALAAAKAVSTRVLEDRAIDELRTAVVLTDELVDQTDREEGLRAWRERRPPAWAPVHGSVVEGTST